ncbi:MAG: hypothetical protein LBR10_11380 [Prevotellaceae bacterium]|jgi:hypothetical protein|nr:hypothetical protein [Prevotellaceae bacterium]
MKKKGKVSDYVKANRKGSREAELEISAGWTSKTKIHKSRKQYNRKGQNWKNDSDLFPLKKFNYEQERILNCGNGNRPTGIRLSVIFFLGGEFLFEKMNFFERAVIKRIAITILVKKK